jgi:hypothetical protein
MARYTTAYSSFIARLVEIEILLRFARKKERSDPVGLRHEINALCRGAIVLLSSHLEAYIKDLGELAMDSLHSQAVPRSKIASKFFYHISKSFFDEVQATTDPGKLADRLFSFINDDLGYWEKTGVFPVPIPVDRFNKGFSNPAFSKINSYLKRFGYPTYERDLAQALQAQFHVTKNMVDHLVDMRNKIAHGDPSATKTPNDVTDMMTSIRSYTSATDAVFAGWWKTTFCTIR